jgi:hypothetical protein
VGATPWRFKSSHPHSQIRRRFAPRALVADTFSHIVHVYGRAGEGPTIALDHELQVGELIDHDGQPMRVVAARSEDREDGRVRIVHVEPLSGR